MEDNIEYKLSEWSRDPPPYDGCWEILTNDDSKYFALYKDGKWGIGYRYPKDAKKEPFYPYPNNNRIDVPISWRGRLPD